MKIIVIATGNQHKVYELSRMCRFPDLEFKSLADYREIPEAVEDGKNFQENAEKKARHASRYLQEYCLADDSGLAVDALDGRPGIYSSRYAPTDEKRIAKLLDEMKPIPPEKRTARFICSMALCSPRGDVIIRTGYCEGVIAEEPRGSNGFGYDPVFYLPEKGKTMAQLPPEEKNRISHRANAAKLMAPEIQKLILKKD